MRTLHSAEGDAGDLPGLLATKPSRFPGAGRDRAGCRASSAPRSLGRRPDQDRAGHHRRAAGRVEKPEGFQRALFGFLKEQAGGTVL